MKDYATHRGYPQLREWISRRPAIVVSDSLTTHENDMCLGVSNGHFTICLSPGLPPYIRDVLLAHELGHLLAERRDSALMAPNFGMVRFNQAPPKRELEGFVEDIAIEVRATAIARGIFHLLGIRRGDARDNEPWVRVPVLVHTIRMVLRIDAAFIRKVVDAAKDEAVDLAHAPDLLEQIDRKLEYIGGIK